jgi:hypothetical protein
MTTFRNNNLLNKLPFPHLNRINNLLRMITMNNLIIQTINKNRRNYRIEPILLEINLEWTEVFLDLLLLEHFVECVL